MTDTSFQKFGTRRGGTCRERSRWVPLAVCGALMLAGCAHVPSRQQRLVSKPNMQFDGSPMFSSLNRLLTQSSSRFSVIGGVANRAALFRHAAIMMKRSLYDNPWLANLLRDPTRCAHGRNPLFSLRSWSRREVSSRFSRANCCARFSTPTAGLFPRVVELIADIQGTTRLVG
jgi:hypothetical protein